MTIKAGDKIPSVALKRLGADGMEEVTTDELFSGKKVVMFGLPGAFTPTCSAKHLPGFIDKADQISAKGVDSIICMSVNDPFVMQAWGEQQGVGDKIAMLPDGNGDLTKAMGLELDVSVAGLGTRSHRFAMVVDDGTVTSFALEENPSGLDVSSAEAILASL